MIKRSVPSTLLIKCSNRDYAEGVKDAIMWTLENLMHECDIILRMSPTVEKITPDSVDEDGLHLYQVRARFTAREKMSGRAKGQWIKMEHAFYEEEEKNDE